MHSIGNILLTLFLAIFLLIGCSRKENLVLEPVGIKADEQQDEQQIIITPTPTNDNGLYVDSLLGSNSNPGTMEAPLANLQWATDIAFGHGKVVFVAGGAGRRYNSVWAKTDIYCGYNPGDWSEDRFNFPSSIGGDKYFGVGIASGFSANIDGCVIEGGGSEFQRTIGVIAKGVVRLTKNKIDGGYGTNRTYGVFAGAPSGCNLIASNNLITGGVSTEGNSVGVVNARCDITLVNNDILSDGGSSHTFGVNSRSGAISTIAANNIIDGGSTDAENRAVGIDSPSKVKLINNALFGTGSLPDGLVG